jgi:hypothetical protein
VTEDIKLFPKDFNRKSSLETLPKPTGYPIQAQAKMQQGISESAWQAMPFHEQPRLEM